MFKVLVADDEDSIREILKYSLNKNGMEVCEARTGKEVLESLRSFSADFIILDIMMPEMDGYEVCRELRKTSEVPILMVTAKGEEYDRVLGLELGADDYMIKPFSPRELIARMKAIYRRIDSGHPIKVENEQEAYTNGDLKIHIKHRKVTVKKEVIIFKPREFDLLAYLAKSPGQVFTREALLHHVWGYDFIGDIRTVDVHVKKIREKLKEKKSDVLQTVWGVGYKFEPKL
ncbi:DNA-binding response regulator [Salipaludibacillus neizhouensis]|uniref:DNA-binding response regulator n=1 Tax=Salipaludibacillus neizhouensis TaxID=885475 RepID=A0A3A9KK23_9BACI|nr:response regulator transcription factor [Salipaludibacillus neizhouensis]RKL68135.1 DNA-binding response regulator [Salipaludibacillus neizhouensis]